MPRFHENGVWSGNLLRIAFETTLDFLLIEVFFGDVLASMLDIKGMFTITTAKSVHFSIHNPHSHLIRAHPLVCRQVAINSGTFSFNPGRTHPLFSNNSGRKSPCLQAERFMFAGSYI